MGLIYAVLAGIVARWVFRAPRPSFPVAIGAGVLGTIAGAPVVHRVSGGHEFHAFQPESFIAGLLGAVVVLSVARLVTGRYSSDPRRLIR